MSMRHARQIIEDWLQEYKDQRSHSSLGYLTPMAFKKMCGLATKPEAVFQE